MTTGIALVLALSLFVNNVTLLCASDFSFLKDGHEASTFVFLFSVCLLVSEISFLPSVMSRKYPLIFCLLEVPISMIIIEFSLFYLWGGIHDMIYLHADDFMLFFKEDLGLEWLVCYFCRNYPDCTESFIDLFLKIVSFDVLLLSCVAYYYYLTF